MFTTHPLNAIESVKDQNIFEVFTYLSWKSASVEYENEVKKSMNEEQEQKQRAKKNKR